MPDTSTFRCDPGFSTECQAVQSGTPTDFLGAPIDGMFNVINNSQIPILVIVAKKASF
jgi:hypothetical protein